ncbi:non-specific lipid transfer protein GPI-anchored 5-like [Salvia divinorum]|uniref:Non-specific lipid transfer protein GPI-anchored 5-like n=1 Tax=Salvia divinorum TaxID=28513 RepID=A0ABD1GGM3_SALDI
MGFAVILAAALLAGMATAQSSDCTNVLISMFPCLNYFSGNSSAPSSGFWPYPAHATSKLPLSPDAMLPPLLALPTDQHQQIIPTPAQGMDLRQCQMVMVFQEQLQISWVLQHCFALSS